MENPFKLHNAVLLLVLWMAGPLQAHARAGTAQFTAGEVTLRQADGRVSALSRGGSIDSGNTIVTGDNGRAQLRFSDGGMVSLQPHTEFRIANYVDQNDAKEDRFLVDLLRGSLRAITGLIGKRKRDNYKLTTNTATIGIRGSGFKVGYNPDGSVGITSELDKIEVCNASGCIGLVAGESVVVQSNNAPPVRTSQQPKLDTPPPEKEPTVVGEKVDDAGKAAIVPQTSVASTVPETAAAPQPVVREFSDISVTGVATNVTAKHIITPASTAPITVFSDNKLLSLRDDSSSNGAWKETGAPLPESSFHSVGNVSDANFIGWGTWTSGQKDAAGITLLDHVHYVAGRRTSEADLSALAYSGTASYTLLGGTASRSGVLGTLDSAIFSVNFSTGYSLSATFNTSFGQIVDTASGSSPAFAGSYMQGMFIGPHAAYAGVAFGKDLGNGMVTGAAAFKKQ